MSSEISRWNRFRDKHNRELTAYKLLGIPLTLWFIFFVFALFRAFFISLTDWNLLSQASFIGLDNYKEILSNRETINIFKNTIIWTLFIAISHNVLGLFTAYMLNEIPKGESVFRTLLYWPVLVSLVVGAEMIKYIFNPSPFGLMNSILIKIGMEPMAWYQSPRIALISLIIFPMLTGFGIKMIIYQAGFKGIPKSIYEAAKLDGASEWQQFTRITLPLIKPVIILNFVMSTIEGFRVLAPMQLVTNGGPISSTETVVLSIYKHGFVKNNMGYASALAFILFGIILLIAAIQLKLQGEDISYE
ncbi:MAG: sugar ABC transporter permease [Clostridia bacterium]|nr:sugar ABC transporter permease [Clostridia bacterium]